MSNPEYRHPAFNPPDRFTIGTIAKRLGHPEADVVAAIASAGVNPACRGIVRDGPSVDYYRLDEVRAALAWNQRAHAARLYG
ncbi:MAG: hypothetical protein U0575_07390 [Phycisphaerales bacterium]